MALVNRLADRPWFKFWWPPIVSACLYLAAFPPLNLGLLVLVALVPWILQLQALNGKQAFRSGYAMGFIIVMSQMAWTQNLVSQWTGNIFLSGLPWVVCGFLGAFYFGFLGFAIRQCLERRWYWLIPVLWAGMEVMRSYIPGLSFPWFIAATPLWQYTPIIQSAFYGTIYLVSAWVVLMNMIVVLIMQHYPPLKLRSYMGIAGLLMGVSLVRYAADSGGKYVPIMAGQLGMNIAFTPPDQRDFALTPIIDNLIESAESSGSKIIVLPEGLLRHPGSPYNPPFKLPKTIGLIVGGRRGADPLIYQSSFVYEKGTWKYSDKSRLVVFGEYVPGRAFLPFLSSFRLPEGDFTAGDHVEAFDVAGIRVGPLVCFEAMFYDPAHQQTLNGAQLLVVESIDDWYMGTSAPEQLKAHTIWRAVETGLPVVRSASLGYTMAVNAKGLIVAELPLMVTRGLRVEMQVPDAPEQNPFRPVFPWIAPFSWLYLVGVVLRERIQARRSQNN